uniref:Uncharacterized protein n=1 Tax=Rhizophora mucronata TaxID=61149 RepID=A0A2P2R3I7_RHIMU
MLIFATAKSKSRSKDPSFSTLLFSHGNG